MTGERQSEPLTFGTSDVEGVTGVANDYFGREELHKLVWAKPMIEVVAAQFDAPTSYLARVCTDRRVPRPGRGYWAKIEAGAAVMSPSSAAPTWTAVRTKAGMHTSRHQTHSRKLRSVEAQTISLKAKPVKGTQGVGG